MTQLSLKLSLCSPALHFILVGKADDVEGLHLRPDLEQKKGPGPSLGFWILVDHPENGRDQEGDNERCEHQ